MRTNIKDQFSAQERADFKPKIVARNTFRFMRGGETVYRLHGTDIVRVLPDGSAILNSGGYRTVTTKDRINRYLPGGNLSQERGQWYVTSGEQRIPFYDGIQVPQCFDKPGARKRGERDAAERGKLRKAVNQFVAKLDELDELPKPSRGDCFFCQLRTDGGKSLGDASGDSTHLLDHIEEGYLHGSLIMNALSERCGSPAFVWQLESGKGDKRITKLALRHYLKRRLRL